MVRISIAALIYRSTRFAEWLYEGLHKYTPALKTGEAEFFFVANDPTEAVVRFLEERGYPHFVQRNPILSDEELFSRGIGKPEYLSRVYRGYNEAIRRARGERVVLLNSDNYPSPDWLENLLKYSSRDTIACSYLVERKHPKYEVYPGAAHGEFGDHPDRFDEAGFLSMANRLRLTGLRAGGAYMPCMLYRDIALDVGLYPEGNLAGASFDQVVATGDAAFFRKMESRGIRHATALDSIVYHLKEGEMDESMPQLADQREPSAVAQEDDLAAGLALMEKGIRLLLTSAPSSPTKIAEAREALELVETIARKARLKL